MFGLSGRVCGCLARIFSHTLAARVAGAHEDPPAGFPCFRDWGLSLLPYLQYLGHQPHTLGKMNKHVAAEAPLCVNLVGTQVSVGSPSQNGLIPAGILFSALDGGVLVGARLSSGPVKPISAHL